MGWAAQRARSAWSTSSAGSDDALAWAADQAKLEKGQMASGVPGRESRQLRPADPPTADQRGARKRGGAGAATRSCSFARQQKTSFAARLTRHAERLTRVKRSAGLLPSNARPMRSRRLAAAQGLHRMGRSGKAAGGQLNAA